MDPIPLEPAEYWKLMKLEADLRYAQEKASLITAGPMAARAAWLKVLCEKYPAFQPLGHTYRSDDETCTLSPT